MSEEVTIFKVRVVDDAGEVTGLVSVSAVREQLDKVHPEDAANIRSVREPPIPLVSTFDPTGDPVCFVCISCKRLCRTLDDAWTCCAKACERCSLLLNRRTHPYTHCNTCRPLVEAEREQAAFNKAQKVSYAEYDGTWLYVTDGIGSMDGYFRDLDELLDEYYDRGKEPPLYAWSCFSKPVYIDPDDVIDAAVSDHYDGARDALVGVAELHAFMKTWNAKQTACTYEPDRDVAVSLEADVLAYVRDRGPFVDPEEPEEALALAKRCWPDLYFTGAADFIDAPRNERCTLFIDGRPNPTGPDWQSVFQSLQHDLMKARTKNEEQSPPDDAA